jgi:isopentenyl-diphosphate delta-isomerase type 1
VSEYLEIVDVNDQVIGTARRSECHGNPQLIHRVAHVLLFDHAGRLLLQKRSPSKDVQPGKWDTSVGGHLDRGETYLAAAAREMFEELGIAGLPLTYLYSYQLRSDFESENVATFTACHDGPFPFSRTEITAVKFWTRTEIDAALGRGILTPNFAEEWARWQALPAR